MPSVDLFPRGPRGLKAVDSIADGYPEEGDQWRGSFYVPGVFIVAEPGPSKGIYVNPPVANLTFRLEIAFTDDNGTRWRKYGAEGLHEVPRGRFIGGCNSPQ